MMTLALVQGHQMACKVWKKGLLLISWTLLAVLSRYKYHIVANTETFAETYEKMTLTLVEGHWMAYGKLKGTYCMTTLICLEATMSEFSVPA